MYSKISVLIFLFSCVGVSYQGSVDIGLCPPLPSCPRPPPGCNYLFTKDENGCVVSCAPLDCTCQSQLLCPPCPDGYSLDKVACDSCECKAEECPPLPPCPSPPAGCDYILERDANDCIISCGRLDCECQEQLCPSCPNGYVQDENGCDICECKDVCPPPPPCARPPLGCDYILERDENDCIIGCGRLDCQCQEQLCPPCPNGYVQDENGCDTCECKETCPDPPQCPAPPVGCTFIPINDENGCLVSCDYDCDCELQFCPPCPDGYVKDENGCDTCECEPIEDKCPPPPPASAPPPEGCTRNPINDENGCLVDYDVKCECPKLKCQYCPGGYVQDAKGCQTCQCRPKGRGYLTGRRNCRRGRGRGGCA